MMTCLVVYADPAKRIGVKELQDHPWYMKDLPPGVKEMNDNMRMPPSGSQVRTALRCALVGRGMVRYNQPFVQGCDS